MNSERLSARAKQPGHDRTFVTSEQNFVAALDQLLPADQFRIVDHPSDLRKILGGSYGVVPEASIEYIPTGYKMYFEVKKQGPAGNADERACKHHTVQFYKTLAAHTGYDYHAFCTIMCESLATLDRYTVKHPYFFDSEHYLLWVDYRLDILDDYLRMITDRFLAASPGPPDAVPQ